MDSDTGDSQLEGQVQEVSSSGGAVIEMQEFSDTDDNPYEVPIPSSPTVMSSVNPNAPVNFVPALTNNETVHLHPVSAFVLPSSSLEKQQGAVGGNKQTLPKTVEGEFDPYANIPPKGLVHPVMNIAPRSIRMPLKKIPSKFKEGGWVLDQGNQTEKIIKTVIHRHVQYATRKKQGMYKQTYLLQGDLDMHVTKSAW